MLNHNRGGVGSYYRCWHLARGLTKLGHRVCLVTVSPTRRIRAATHREDGVTMIETPNLLDLLYGVGTGFGPVGIAYRMLFAVRNDFDIIHAFEHKPNVLLPAAFRHALDGTPLVADWADWWRFTSE